MGNDAPIGVLLGADSLIGMRSGVGRQTLEVARLLRRCPAVGELALLMGRSCLPADTLDALDDVQRLPDASGVAHALVAALPGAIAFRANWQRWWMRRAATPMSQRMGGRVVYHEANLIARVDYADILYIAPILIFVGVVMAGVTAYVTLRLYVRR